jgi:hypothetical protein
MPVRGHVSDEQRPITALDANYHHSANRLEQVLARRTNVLAEHERLAVATLIAVDEAAADMADQFSSGLAAQLLGTEPAQVRRLANAHPVTTKGPGTDGPTRSVTGAIGRPRARAGRPCSAPLSATP